MNAIGAAGDDTETPRDDEREDKSLTIPSRDSVEPVTCVQVVAISLAVVLPNVVLIAGFSALGFGLEVFDLAAPASLHGDGCMTLAAVMCMVLYVLNWTDWQSRILQFLALLVPWIVACAGSVLKGRKYPWAPMLMTLVHVAIFLGLLRKRPCKRVKRGHFYMVVFCLTLLCALALGVMWVSWVTDGHSYNDALREEWATSHKRLYKAVYKPETLVFERHCGPNKDLSAYSIDEKTEIKLACSVANTVHFLVWACPAIGFFCNLMMSTFVLLTCLALHAASSASKLEAVLKRFVLVLTLLIMGMYGSASFAGTSIRLGSTLMAFFAGSLALLLVWLLVEMKPEGLYDVQKSKFAEMLVKLQSSDWVRAVFVGGCNVIIPLFFFLDMMRQSVRRCCSKRADAAEFKDRFTPFGQRMIGHLEEWNWPSILCKICILGEIFFTFQVGVAKATYVFLSWLNATLRDLEYGLVICIIFVIGYTMFLLPPVPGVPVYVFCGVVVAEQGRQIDGVGTIGGCVVAVLLAFTLKMCACVGQYCIGFFLGKLVKIQQLIGVDKVPTRAIEQILKTRGLSVGKVSVLVGGPDWPVSVTCGILKLSVGQMLLGTAPVIVVLSPCVLAGAFMARVTGGEESIWNVLANSFLGLSVVGQMGSMCMAMYCITKVIDKDSEKLAEPREEHKAVALLTAAEAQYVKTYEDATDWRTLHPLRKAVVITAAALVLLSGFIFAFMDETCFENFNISSNIKDGLTENGLGGNVLNIIKRPGYGALGMFFLGVFLHLVFLKDMEMKAKRLLRSRPPEEYKAPSSPTWAGPAETTASNTDTHPHMSAPDADALPTKKDPLQEPGVAPVAYGKSEPKGDQ